MLMLVLILLLRMCSCCATRQRISARGSNLLYQARPSSSACIRLDASVAVTVAAAAALRSTRGCSSSPQWCKSRSHRRFVAATTSLARIVGLMPPPQQSPSPPPCPFQLREIHYRSRRNRRRRWGRCLPWRRCSRGRGGRFFSRRPRAGFHHKGEPREKQLHVATRTSSSDVCRPVEPQELMAWWRLCNARMVRTGRWIQEEPPAHRNSSAAGCRWARRNVNYRSTHILRRCWRNDCRSGRPRMIINRTGAPVR